MPTWERMRLIYRVDDARMGGSEDFRPHEDRVSRFDNRLVKATVRRLGGRERPLFWSDTDIPAYLGLISTGNVVMPARVITNAPGMGEPRVKLRIADRVHDFSAAPIEHHIDQADPQTSHYAGVLQHWITNRSNRPGNYFLRHQVTVNCYDEFAAESARERDVLDGLIDLVDRLGKFGQD